MKDKNNRTVTVTHVKMSSDHYYLTYGENAKKLTKGITKIKKGGMTYEIVDKDLLKKETEEKLAAKIGERILGSKIQHISYNSKKETLIIGDIHISLQKAPLQANLCKTLFKNKASIEKIWQRDPMLVELDFSEEDIMNSEGKTIPKYKLVIYTAAGHINKKVSTASKGEINDLLTFTPRTVAINTKYQDLIQLKK